jgi:eukaryotic-like serine/threonine-protein kinase
MVDPSEATSEALNKAHDLTGTNVGRFTVGSRLGTGGMGDVYRAEDTTLKRVVAIKRLLPQSQYDSRDRERFLKEAQRASALNHPNVAVIYEVLQEQGEIFLVMEYVEGVTLRQRMRTPISVEEFLDIAVQCVEGLVSAHDKHFVHGDIKPENIMLTTAQRVKILDFGVAKRFTSAGSTDVTANLTSISASLSGTPAYMAPEMLMQKPYDGRADIFSLGLVFYELLGGKQPFVMENFAGTLGRVLHFDPMPVDMLNHNVSPPLSLIASKMMMKDPALRYPNLRAVAGDLRILQRNSSPQVVDPTRSLQKISKRPFKLMVMIAVLVLAAAFVAYRPVEHYLEFRQKTTTAALPDKKIIAVLPFHSADGNAKLTAFGQGLVESVAAKLGALAEDRSLEVVPARNMQEKSATSLDDARRLFGANLGLAIRLEQSGGLMRVSYSMMDTTTGAAVGSDSITVPASDVFAVEDDIAAGAVGALGLRLLPGEQATIRIHGTSHPAAYENFLRGRGYLLDYTKPDNVENAILMIREALAHDANFGMAKAALGEAYWRKYSLTKSQQWTVLAKKECDEALQLGNAGASGHSCLGLINDGTGHYKEAAVQYQRAVELEPTNENAYIGLALAFEHQGSVAHAATTYQRVVDIHPQSWVSYNAAGAFYYRQGEYEKAIEMFHKVTELAPEGFAGYVNLGATYNNTGRYSEAIEPLNKSITLRPAYAAYSNLGTAYFGLHKYSEAAKSYEEAIRLSPDQYVSWGNLGIARYYGGAKTEATGSFRKAIELAGHELNVNPRDADVLGDLANYYAMLGDRKQSLSALEKSLQYERNSKELIFNAADVYNQLGETGLALEWLAKAVNAGYSVDKFQNTAAFSNLAGNPRYQELIGRIPASR